MVSGGWAVVGLVYGGSLLQRYYYEIHSTFHFCCQAFLLFCCNRDFSFTLLLLLLLLQNRTTISCFQYDILHLVSCESKRHRARYFQILFWNEVTCSNSNPRLCSRSDSRFQRGRMYATCMGVNPSLSFCLRLHRVPLKSSPQKYIHCDTLNAKRCDLLILFHPRDLRVVYRDTTTSAQSSEALARCNGVL